MIPAMKRRNEINGQMNFAKDVACFGADKGITNVARTVAYFWEERGIVFKNCIVCLKKGHH